MGSQVGESGPLEQAEDAVDAFALRGAVAGVPALDAPAGFDALSPAAAVHGGANGRASSGGGQDDFVVIERGVDPIRSEAVGVTALEAPVDEDAGPESESGDLDGGGFVRGIADRGDIGERVQRRGAVGGERSEPIGMQDEARGAIVAEPLFLVAGAVEVAGERVAAAAFAGIGGACGGDRLVKEGVADFVGDGEALSARRVSGVDLDSPAGARQEDEASGFDHLGELDVGDAAQGGEEFQRSGRSADLADLEQGVNGAFDGEFWRVAAPESPQGCCWSEGGSGRVGRAEGHQGREPRMLRRIDS